jgi:peptide deformylase
VIDIDTQSGMSIEVASRQPMLEVIVWQRPLQDVRCSPVTEFNTRELKDVVTMLYEANARYKGLGVAAAQCGIFKRLAVLVVPDEESITLINPRLSEQGELVRVTEACLSLPGYRDRIMRHATVVCDFQNEQGEWKTVVAEGLLAQAIQHEVDHMDGKFYIDHMSRMKRNLILDKHLLRVKKEVRRRKVHG